MVTLLQSIADRVVFKAYLASDGVTQATGKTIAVVLSKNGAAFGNPSAGATNATEIAQGWYYVDLSTTDKNTLGPLIVRGTEGTIDNVETVFYIVKATNAGLTALPDTAVTTNASLLTSGTGTAQLSVGSGLVRLSATGVADILASALTEAYAADGAAFTLTQALYEICQALSEFAITGTTISVKKRDGTTEAMTYTLNSATTPTSRARAT